MNNNAGKAVVISISEMEAKEGRSMRSGMYQAISLGLILAASMMLAAHVMLTTDIILAADTMLTANIMSAAIPAIEEQQIRDLYPLSRTATLPAIASAELVADARPNGIEVAQTNGVGPTVGSNAIIISIASEPSSAGSDSPYLEMIFDSAHCVRLWGCDGGTFPAGLTLTWNLNDVAEWLAAEVSQDSWDTIALRNRSYDSLRIANVRIIHSSQVILDWAADLWLGEGVTSHVGLAASILERKLATYLNPVQATIHYALRELGKTDGSKYGTTGAWCSEFASWCIRRSGWDTPQGSIGTVEMQSYFNAVGRLYSQNQITAGAYLPRMGDYLSVFNGAHSALFVGWYGGVIPAPATLASRCYTIEGNVSGAVQVTNRSIAEIDHVGCAQ